MKSPEFQNLPEEEQEWLDAYLDGTIATEAFEAFQDRLQESPGLRVVTRRYLSIDDTLTNGLELDSASSPWIASDPTIPEFSAAKRKTRGYPAFFPVAAAAALAFLLGIGLMYQRSEVEVEENASAQGFAVLGKLFDAEWESADTGKREGDFLGAENFRLASGTAEIQFFSGAIMTVEGPAQISLKSAWEATCREGAVRMKVPPAARGFKLHAPGSEIIDLGTEFGLSVENGVGRVEVFDGEISLRHQDSEEKLVEKGGAFLLDPARPAVAIGAGDFDFPDVSRFGSRSEDEARIDFEKWKAHRDALARDDRLIAYYTFDRDGKQGLVPNLTVPRNPEFDGAVILAEPVDGRWAGLKSALEFRRPGSRVRVNIPGEFPAFTFAAWVRIDSLDRRYNALFMGDGYETGEPHWQIRDDGALMLSVMVDDSKPNPHMPEDAGFHRVYFSPPIWDMSKAGQWMHLVSVFDPQSRAVSHYLDGRQISTQEIEDRFFIESLRIGNGEIGNWGLPFREDPWFAIRHLNGRMDEIAIFRAALGEEEVAALFEKSRARR